MFFFEQKTAYVMRISDWSSDVCSSDLGVKWSATARFEALTPLVEIIYRHWNCLIADSLFLYAPAAEGECMNSILYTIGYEGSDIAHFLLTKSEEQTSELQSLMRTSYAVCCLKQKNTE